MTIPVKYNTKLHFFYTENMRFFILFSLLLIIFQAIQTTGIDLSFCRTAIAEHEKWRLVSGGLVHANFAHLLLNCLGLFCLLSLYDRQFPLYCWSLISLFLVFCVNVGLYFILPDTEHYVGFSGALHGLFVWYSIVEWREKRAWFPISVLVILVCKLCIDSFVTDSFSHQIIGMRVHWQSHWLGSISGALLSLLYKKHVLHRT